jgi:uncharacterized repeat protein (TIGR03803 family)
MLMKISRLSPFVVPCRHLPLELKSHFLQHRLHGPELHGRSCGGGVGTRLIAAADVCPTQAKAAAKQHRLYATAQKYSKAGRASVSTTAYHMMRSTPMETGKTIRQLRWVQAITMLALLGWGLAAWAQTEQTLYSFIGGPTDGGNPYTGPITDAKGNLYGATSNGGPGVGGIVYALIHNAQGKWKEKILYSFPAFSGDGSGLQMQHLAIDKHGALYGVTVGGGANNDGIVFKLSPGTPQWKETILHTFTGADGAGYNNGGGLTFDAKGNLYGTTSVGGDPACNCGVVFQLHPLKNGTWSFKVLHTFTGFPPGAQCGSFYDGADPGNNTPAVDSAGNVYGTTSSGGNGCSNGGTVWELSPVQGGGWNYSILHYMNGDADTGAYSGGVLDSAGNFYYAELSGQIVELVKSQGYALQFLYQPQNCGNPQACPVGNYDTVSFDQAGNLYWASTSLNPLGNSLGALSELSPNGQGGWNLTILYAFPNDGQEGGVQPYAGVTVDASGNVYGTCIGGGTHSEGTVWEITP